MSEFPDTVALTTGILGSVTGVASFVWLVYTHAQDRGRLRVTCVPVTHNDENLNPEKTVYWCQLTNIGKRPIIVTSVDLHCAGGRAFGLMGGKNLPASLGPGEFVTVEVPDPREAMGDVVDVTAKDSLGKVYRISRKNRRQLTG